MGTDLRRHVSACVFPLGQVRCALRVSREFYPTRRHDAKPGHRPAPSIKHTVSPATRNAKLGHWTRTFPILWDMTVTQRSGWRTRSEQTKTNSVLLDCGGISDRDLHTCQCALLLPGQSLSSDKQAIHPTRCAPDAAFLNDSWKRDILASGQTP